MSDAAKFICAFLGAGALCFCANVTWAVEELPDVTAPAIFPGQSGTVTWLVVRPVGEKIEKITTSCGCSWANPLVGDRTISAQGVPIKIQYTSATPGDHAPLLFAFKGQGDGVPIARARLLFHVFEVVKSEASSGSANANWSKLELMKTSAETWTGSRVFVLSDDGPRWKTLRVSRLSFQDRTDDFWKLEVHEQVPGTWALGATLTPHSLMGRWATKVQLEFLDEHDETLPYRPTFMLYASIPGPVSALPETLLVGALSHGEERKVRFIVQREAGWDVQLASSAFESSPLVSGEVHAVPDPSHPDSAFEVTVRAVGGSGSGTANGGVILVWRDGSRLRIPFIAAVLGP
jgi:hypothetical protein